MRLVDSHAHLQSDRLRRRRRRGPGGRTRGRPRAHPRPGLEPALVARAASRSRERARRADLGGHPSARRGATPTTPRWAEIRALARRPEVAAIGETGLDYDRVFSPRDAAREPAPPPRARAGAGQAARPPLPLGGRRARCPGRAHRRAAGGRGRGGRWRARFGDRPPASSTRSPARSTTPRRPSDGPRGQLQRARLPGRRGGAPRSPGSCRPTVC